MGLGRTTRLAARLTPVTLVIMGALVLAPARAGATFPGRPGRIAWAYAANDPSYHFSPDYGIQTVGRLGNGSRTLVSCNTGDPNGNSILCPSFGALAYSADGTRLAWDLTTTSGVDELVVAKADGTDQRTIVHPGENDFEPSFSPRGDRLSYVRIGRSGRREIVTSNLAGGHVRLLTTVTGRNPTFSPDGRRVLFIHGYSAWVVGSDGRGAHRLLTHSVSADWSPNGKSIVVVTPYGLIRTARADGTGLFQLRITFPGGVGEFSPSLAVFSPDGKSIAFNSIDDTSSPNIYTVPVRGGRARDIDAFNTDDEGPVGSGVFGLSWQPLP
ncbi:MAG: TolB family protein [Solirubrobacteraceae bacterium]